MKQLTPEFSYFMGFAQSDGCLSEGTRRRGKFTVEIKKDDSDFLYILGDLSGQKYSVNPRHRDTNFKKNYESKVLCICDLGFREYLKTLGMVAGRKDRLVSPPPPAIQKDYIRGYLDGNGSLGFTQKNIPIISITTGSDSVKKYVLNCISKYTGKEKNINRNSRDDIYNIALTGEDAVSFITKLYEEPCISMPRKKDLAKLIVAWKRPDGLKRIPDKKFWTPEQDIFILRHSYEESEKHLSRSKKSIKTRYWRLTGKCPIQVRKENN